MKLQYLAVIFLIIIMPIVMVLSQYIDYQIDAINLKHTYNTKLLEATYDSIKAYQLNTVNNAISDISATKIGDLEAAVKTFFNSLSTNFNYSGYNSGIINDYVPAVVFSMYDGYYIYSPYRNVLTGVSNTEVDEKYKNNEILNGIKSYVYYSCRYKNDTIGNSFDIVITYTLDNYITIQGEVNGNFINEYGYLIDGIEKNSTGHYEDGKEIFNYKYDGITFEYNNNTELLKEYLGDNKEYPYVKINGTKYYWDKKSGANDEIFYINVTGERAVQARENDDNGTFKEYKDFIEKNNSAYRYYRDAYKFTKFVHDTFGDLTVEQAVDWGEGGSPKSLIDILGDQENYFSSEYIFGEDDDGDNITGDTDNSITPIQDSDSNFNAHRSAIIRYTIEKNLETAITGFRNYSKVLDAEYIMPEISDIDWATIQNNVSIITFLQGFNIAGRDYNEYCVVANNLTKEYVDENDIYILGKDGMYYKPNDKTLNEIKTGLGYEPGIWKINFGRKNYKYAANDNDNYQNYYYYPIRYESSGNSYAYLGSYSSIVNSTSIDSSYQDLYKYMRATEEDGTTKKVDESIRTTYYTALARERWGQYSVNNDIDLVQGNILNQDVLEEVDAQVPNVTLTAEPNTSRNNWTKQNVILTGKATDNSSIIEFNFEPNGNKKNIIKNEQKEVESTLTISESGKHEYIFYAKDDSNNIKSKSKTIYIDKESPSIIEFVTLNEQQTKDSITVEARIKDNHSGIEKYSITNSQVTPNEYDQTISATTQEQQVTKKISKNGTYYLHVKDKAGNTSYQELVVNNIDKTPPTISVNPSSLEVCKNNNITITITDNEGGSGLPSDEILCYLSTSATENTKTQQYSFTSGQPFIIGEDLTGTYYLWVESVTDIAGNKTNTQRLGDKFIFDNTSPDINIDIDDEKDIDKLTVNKNVTITFIDEPAGMASNTGICYLSTSATENTKTQQYSFTSGQSFSIGKGLTGNYYIWIDSVSDKLGNTRPPICVTELSIKLDNEAPTVSVNPSSSNLSKNSKVTITLKDNEGGSGLSINEWECYLSTSSSTNTKTKKYDYTSGTPFTIGENLTGTYYLWVGDVSDKAGNINKEHYIGKFVFDNMAPTISSFKVKESNENSITVETLAVDNGTAGIYSYSYYIVNSDTTEKLPSVEKKSTNSSDSYTFTNLNAGSKYDVYVVVTDSLGNSATSETITSEIAGNYMITTGTSKQYKSTLADAVSASSNGSTITLMRDVEQSIPCTIKQLKDLKIDLNGNTLKSEHTVIVISYDASVKFVGSGYIVKTSHRNYNNNSGVIVNNGNCTVNFEEDGGIISDAPNNFDDADGIYNRGNLTIKSGNIVSNNRDCITTTEDSILNINGGTISHNGYDLSSGIWVVGDNVSVTINDGIISSNLGNGLDVSGNSYHNQKIRVNGGKIISNSNAAIMLDLYNDCYTTLELFGGLISGKKYGIYTCRNGSEVIVGNLKDTYDKNAVTIEGGQHSIYCIENNNKLVNVSFYNGILKTKTIDNEVLSGIDTKEIRQGYNIVDEKDETTQTRYKYLASSLEMDKIEPTVTVNPSSAEVCKNKQITITLTDDGGSGLQSNNGTYYLSTSKTNNDKAISNVFTSGTPFTIGENLTGTYYLWVGDVSDKAGNINKEHYIGKFVFDNMAPTISSFAITSSTSSSITVKTKAVDSGPAGIYEYEYYISNSSNSIGSLKAKNNSTSTINTYTYNDLTLGTTYYLTTIVKDKLGNKVQSNTITVKHVDNYMITTGTSKVYKSTLADAVSVSSNGSTITLMKDATDNSSVTISDLSNLKIDLNEKTLTRNSKITITSTSTVNFVGKGYIKTNGVTSDSLILNGGNCTINFEENNGLKHVSNQNTSAIQNTGTLTIKSGNIEEKYRNSYKVK